MSSLGFYLIEWAGLLSEACDCSSVDSLADATSRLGSAVEDADNLILLTFSRSMALERRLILTRFASHSSRFWALKVAAACRGHIAARAEFLWVGAIDVSVERLDYVGVSKSVSLFSRQQWFKMVESIPVIAARAAYTIRSAGAIIKAVYRFWVFDLTELEDPERLLLLFLNTDMGGTKKEG